MSNYKLKVLRTFARDLEDVLVDKSQYYEGTPRRFMLELRKVLDQLADNPKIYEAYRYNKKYHAVLIDKYLLFYRISKSSDIVKIYRLLRANADIVKYL